MILVKCLFEFYDDALVSSKKSNSLMIKDNRCYAIIEWFLFHQQTANVLCENSKLNVAM